MKTKFLIIIILLVNNIFCNVTDEKITNPVIAMGLSAVVPGGGQIYNGDWKKGLIFLGLELISFNQMNKYNKSAKSYVRDYENYADEYWNVEKWLQDFYLFVDWIPENYNNLSENVFYDSDLNYIDIGEYSHGPDFIYNNNGYSHRDPDFKELYDDICGLEVSTVMETGGSCDLYLIPDENAFVQNNNGNSPCNPVIDENCFPYYQMPWGTLVFSNFDDGNYNTITRDYSSVYLVRDHHLYEGIGKYNEFFAGWDDATLEEARQVFKNNTDIATSDKKDYYQNLRNKSNKEFDKEELFLSLIFVNHAVSMFDAFLTSINRTKKVNIESNMNYGYNKGLEINLKW